MADLESPELCSSTAETTTGESEATTRGDANDYSRFENIDGSDEENEESSPPPSEILSFHESFYRSQNLKEMGNVAFKESNFLMAKRHYEEALEIIRPHKEATPVNDITPEKVQEMKSLFISLYGNTSMVHLKEENWSEVITSTAEILKHEPENIKALYRRAVAHHRTGGYEESREGLNLVLSLDSSNAAAKKELAEVLKSLKEQKRKEKNAMSGMFSGGSIYGDREEERQRKIRREKEAEEKLHDEYLQEKLKKRNEGLPESEVEISFDDWKKDRKKREEEEKKKEEDKLKEERKKRERENIRKKQKTTPAAAASSRAEDGVEYDEEDRSAGLPSPPPTSPSLTLLSKIINETTSKGYCYFKRQLPSEENKLIGDITPKAVSSVSTSPSVETLPTPIAPVTTEKATVAASSWNHAGTWEERDTTALVKDRMKELCLAASASLSVGETTTSGGEADMQSALSDAMKAIDMKQESLQSSLEAMKTAISPITGRVSEVQSVEGEAQIVLTRGKKCYLYDFAIKLKIEVTVEETPFSGSLEGNGSGEKAKPQLFKGSLEITDVCPGTGFEWKLTFKKGSVPDRVRRCAHKLKDDIFAKLQSFDSEYRNL
jgi:tetratricopeptide (TPR) repeat protein